jgi:hypothetical protein
MRKYFTCSLLVLTVILCLVAARFTALAQGTTAFTYQGQLHDTGTNANGNYAMIFALYDAPAGGNQIGSAVTNLVAMANGLFTANLDFGAGAFDGTARWLDIKVGFTNGANIVTSSETLSPRVPVAPTPYALYAASAGRAGQLTNSSWNAVVGNYQSYNNVFGIYASNTLVLGLSPNGVLVNGDLQANRLQASGLSLNGNVDLGTNTIFLGNNTGGASLSFDGNMGVNVGGNLDVQNSLNFGNNGGSIQGDNQGGIQTSGNLTLLGNKISFPVQSGGSLFVGTNGDFVFDNNIKISSLGVLHLPGPGGSGSDLSGNVNGLFISSGAQVNGSLNVNNGMYVTGDIHCNGQIYATFYNTSDRNLKEQITPVNGEDILARVVGLPIARWNYKADSTTPHIGPMAQDFYAAFKVGIDEKHIATVDEGGVALAAIQGLNEKLKAKDAQIDSLEKRLAELEKLVKALTQSQ